MSQSQPTVQPTIRKLANVYYTPREGVSVTANAHGEVGKPTYLIHDGKRYPNAQEWIKLVFQNSGKNLQVVIEKSVVGTPRPPTRYVPPSQKSPFGQYI